MNNKSTEVLADVEQFAKKLNVSTRTILRWEKNGKLPAPAMLGKKNKKYWRVSDIDKWLDWERPSRKIFERIKHGE